MTKYKAKPTVVDGIRFHSQKEARRYAELKLLEKTGRISRLRLQPRYALCPLIIEAANVRNINEGVSSLRRLPVGYYIADFEYETLGAVVVEDAKGYKTELYSLKKRWFEAQYGITIREV